MILSRGDYMRLFEDDEQIFSLDGETYPASMEQEIREAKRKQEEERKRIEKEQAEENTKYPTGSCPFKMLRNAYSATCDSKCVFIHGYSCMWANMDTGEHIETAGSMCPLHSQPCTKYCEFYKDGCVLVKALRKQGE